MPTNPYGTNGYYPTANYAPTTPTYMPTPTTYAPPTQVSLINGRAVDSLEDITAAEVPLNGSLAVFPKKDGSLVYVKSVKGDGTIDTRYYVPAPEGFVENPGTASPEQVNQISNQDIMQAIMNIQDQVSNIKDLVQKRHRNNKPNNQNGTSGRDNNA